MSTPPCTSREAQVCLSMWGTTSGSAPRPTSCLASFHVARKETPVSFLNGPLPPIERPIAAFARAVKGTVRLLPDFVSQKLALPSETSFHIRPSASPSRQPVSTRKTASLWLSGHRFSIAVKRYFSSSRSRKRMRPARSFCRRNSGRLWISPILCAFRSNLLSAAILRLMVALLLPRSRKVPRMESSVS